MNHRVPTFPPVTEKLQITDKLQRGTVQHCTVAQCDILAAILSII